MIQRGFEGGHTHSPCPLTSSILRSPLARRHLLIQHATFKHLVRECTFQVRSAELRPSIPLLSGMAAGVACCCGGGGATPPSKYWDVSRCQGFWSHAGWWCLLGRQVQDHSRECIVFGDRCWHKRAWLLQANCRRHNVRHASIRHKTSVEQRWHCMENAGWYGHVIVSLYKFIL